MFGAEELELLLSGIWCHLVAAWGTKWGGKGRGQEASEEVTMGWSRPEEVMLDPTRLVAVDLVRNGLILHTFFS